MNRIGKKGVFEWERGNGKTKWRRNAKKNAVRRGIVKTLTLVIVVGGGGQEKSTWAGRWVRRFFWESLKIKCEVDNFWIFLVMYSVFFGVKEGRLPVKKPRNTEKVPVNIFVI